MNVICNHISILNIFNILKIHIWITISTCSPFFHFLLILSTATRIFGTFSCLQNRFQIFKFFIIICGLSHYFIYNSLLLNIYSILSNCHKVILLYYRGVHFLLLIWNNVTSLVVISLDCRNCTYRPFAASWLMRISVFLWISILIFPFIVKNHNIWFLVLGILPKCILIEWFVCHVIIFNLMKFQKRILVSFICVSICLLKSILSFLIFVNSEQGECFIKLSWVYLLRKLFVMVRVVISLLNYNLIIRLLIFHIIVIHNI